MATLRLPHQSMEKQRLLSLEGTSMQSFKLIRIAAVFTGLLAIGHTLGAPWIPANSGMAAVIEQSMHAAHFNVMGSERSLWDFYVGFGASLSVYLATNAVVLWQLAAIAKADLGRARPMLFSFALSSIVASIVLFRFFFAAPIVLSLLATLCVVLALARRPRSASATVTQ